MNNLPPFHLAIAVNDLALARKFYGDLLGCREGRSDTQWVDFDFYGHQLVAHCVADALLPKRQQVPLNNNPVDGHDVPIPHFGIVLNWDDWQTLAEKLKAAGVEFLIGPYIRFQGKMGEQATMFFLDPFGNALEFKSFRDPGDLFRAF